jgi:hypothetical protein
MLVTDFRVKYFLYKLVCAVFQLSDVGRIHPVRERELRALNKSVDYIEANMPEAMGFDTQRELLNYSLKAMKFTGHVLEFGVFQGGTIRYIAKQLPSGQAIHGFDSFEGLPEAWSGFDLGQSAFSTGGKLPKVPANVTLHKGWFSNTLPEWAQKNQGAVAFMHVDCDLYSSTMDILNALQDRIQPGTVVLFDEYFNYPNWENHEYKAWQEFVKRTNIRYEYLGYARQQVAVRVVSI